MKGRGSMKMIEKLKMSLRTTSAKKSVLHAIDVAEGKQKRSRNNMDKLLKNGRKWAKANGK